MSSSFSLFTLTLFFNNGGSATFAEAPAAESCLPADPAEMLPLGPRPREGTEPWHPGQVPHRPVPSSIPVPCCCGTAEAVRPGAPRNTYSAFRHHPGICNGQCM